LVRHRGKTAADEKTTWVALAYRWVYYHSALKPEFGDGMLFGGRLPQLEESFDALNQGNLSGEAIESVQKLWNNLQPRVKYTHNWE